MAYDIDFGEYFLYDDLTAHLHGLAAAYPAFASLDSIGKSWRGRDVWCMTLTNSATSSHADKPAFYIDAHIHAEELATSHTALYTIWYLLTHYGTDAPTAPANCSCGRPAPTCTSRRIWHTWTRNSAICISKLYS